MEDFTLDLQKLDTSFLGGPESPTVFPERKRDEVPSEDDGPADFTLNMEKWMRGPQSPIASPGRKVDDPPSEDDGPPDFTLNLEKWMRGTETWTKEEVKGSEDVKALHEEEPNNVQEDARKEEIPTKVTRYQSPSVEDEDAQEVIVVEGSEISKVADAQRTQTEALQDTAAEEVQEQIVVEGPESSKLADAQRTQTEALQDTAAKEVFAQISALQAEVERLRLEAEVHQDERQILDQDRAQLRHNCDDMQHQLSRTRVQLTVRAELAEEAAIAQRAGLEEQLQECQAENQALKCDAEAHEESLTQEIDNVHRQLKQRDEIIATLRNGAIQQGKDHESLVQRHVQNASKVVEEHELQTKNLNAELFQTRTDLQETRRVLETVEDENDCLSQEIDRQAQQIESLQARLQADSEAVENVRSKQTSPTLTCALTNSTGNEVAVSEQIAKAATELENLRAQHNEEMNEVRLVHLSESKAMKATLLRAAEGMRKRETRLLLAYESEIETLNTECASNEKRNEQLENRIKELSTRSESRSPPVSPRAPKENAKEGEERIELRAAITLLSRKLKTTQAEVVEAKTALATSQSEHSRTQAALTQARSTISTRMEAYEILHRKYEAIKHQLATTEAEHDSSNRIFEEQTAEIFEQREAEWHRRLDVLLEERSVMSKALMWSWAEKEVGYLECENGEKRMGYRYQYSVPAAH